MAQFKGFEQKIARYRYTVLRAIREYFHQKDFIEIETPYLLKQNTPDPFIDPLWVKSDQYKNDYQLHTSPEIWLKKALLLGLPKIYSLARVFRDDPLDRSHIKEFTMLEWYRVENDLNDLIEDVKQIFTLAQREAFLTVSNKEIMPNFKEFTVCQVIQEHASLDLKPILKDISAGKTDILQIALEEKGDLLPKRSSFFEAFSHLWAKYIEPNLPFNTPVIIKEWPIQLSALAKTSDHDPLFCERFEVYYKGLEIANAYNECTDSTELKDRFKEENKQRKLLGKKEFALDEAFLDTIAIMPECVGIALGIDRLFMAATETFNIKKIALGQNT